MPRYKDADKIIEFINTHLPYSASPDFMDGINDCIRMIDDKNAIPTADVKEVVYGEWINNEGIIECSKCNKQCNYNSWDEPIYSKFCTECGANMKKEDNT